MRWAKMHFSAFYALAKQSGEVVCGRGQHPFSTYRVQSSTVKLTHYPLLLQYSEHRFQQSLPCGVTVADRPDPAAGSATPVIRELVFAAEYSSPGRSRHRPALLL
jgi:hypothetical protein